MTKTRTPPEVSAETAAFRSAMRDVKPLKQVPAAAAGKRKAVVRRRATQAAATTDPVMPLVPDTNAHSVEAADTLSFRRSGVRDQVLRRLRRGLYPVEDALDLHGLGQANARDLLAEFLAHSRNAGSQCVRIVHGKGYRSGARGPILKVAVDTWLRHHPDVLAFTSARNIDGGTGAVYVLLRA
jgi:DNA-nicking Smr family endonuclease